jgi:hypothetical protein
MKNEKLKVISFFTNSLLRDSDYWNITGTFSAFMLVLIFVFKLFAFDYSLFTFSF